MSDVNVDFPSEGTFEKFSTECQRKGINPIGRIKQQNGVCVKFPPNSHTTLLQIRQENLPFFGKVVIRQ